MLSKKKLLAALSIAFCVNATQNIALAQHAKSLKGDSVTTVFLHKMDSTHRADSLRRVALRDEINSLKGARLDKERDELLERLRLQEKEDSMRRSEQLAALHKLKLSTSGFPVAPFSDTLFFIYTRVGSFSAAERAAAVSSKIVSLYDNPSFRPDSLKVIQGESSADIVYQDLVVMTINELEALWYNGRQGEIAETYRNKIRDAIISERDANSLVNLAIRIGAVLLIIAGIFAVIHLINKIFKKIRKRTIRLKDRILQGIRFKGYQFLDSDRELRVVLFLLKVLRLVIIAIALYIALPLMFSVFPWTQGIAETLFSWVLTPAKKVFLGFINYLPNIFAILVIGVVTHYFIKFLKFISSEIENEVLKIPGFYPDWAKPTFNIVKFLVYAFSFIIIFPYLPGSDSPVFRGVSVFVGILFSLGSSSAISNAVAGLVITYMRPFRIGDRIRIGEISGDVVEKTLLVTRIRTIKNEDITVPNAAILSGHTINYTTSAKDLGLILNTGVTIGYDIPWKQVHKLLIDAASSTGGILNDANHKPFVLQTSLDDFYVSYQLNAYTNQSNSMASIYSDLHQNIQDKFNEAGVEIMSPHYRAMRDGNMTSIPSEYLANNYQAPTFDVSVKRDERK